MDSDPKQSYNLIDSFLGVGEGGAGQCWSGAVPGRPGRECAERAGKPAGAGCSRSKGQVP